MRKSGYPDLAFRPSLAAYAAQRADLERTLRSFPIGNWARGAAFTGTTRGREATILGDVRRLVTHEREHVDQIEATLRAL
jgi:hypothetical protein